MIREKGSKCTFLFRFAVLCGRYHPSITLPPTLIPSTVSAPSSYCCTYLNISSFLYRLRFTGITSLADHTYFMTCLFSFILDKCPNYPSCLFFINNTTVFGLLVTPLFLLRYFTATTYYYT